VISKKHVNQTKALYIPTSDFENFIIVANRLPLDTKVTGIHHAANQDAYIIHVHSKRWPKMGLLDTFGINERLMYKFRVDLWRKLRIKLRKLKS